MEGTYDGQGLDAEHKGVRSQVARVGERIFLPQLGKEGLRGGEGGVVEDEVTCSYVSWFVRVEYGD